MEHERDDLTSSVVVALVDAPERVRAVLPRSTHAQIELVDASDRTGGEPPIPPVTSRGATTIGGWPAVTLPIDGPLESLEVALAGLARSLGSAASRTVVLLRPVDASRPPEPGAVRRAIATGLRPALDLTTSQWVAPHAVLLTGPERVTTFPATVRGRDGGRRLAELVDDLGLFAAGSPPARWVHAVATGATRADHDEWADVLRATYLLSCTSAGPGTTRRTA